MSLPKILEIVGGYVYAWEPEQVKIEVTRLRNHSDGRVMGEVCVSTTAPGYAPHLHQAQFNFSSSQSRKGLAKMLTEQYKEAVWGDILEQLCVYTLERVRRGEPATETWIDFAELEKPEYLLDPIILKGVPTILFGEKGVSKSTLALYIYVCLMLPWKDNPLGLTPPDRSVKTLILDWEQEKPIVEYYARRLRLGSDLPVFPLYHRHCARPLADDIQQIEKAIAEKEAEMIIIDSLGAACGGELNKPEAPLAFFAALRQLKITSLIIAQTNKSQETERKTIFGSTYFTYYARSVFEVCKGELSGDDDIDVALFHRWSNYSKLTKPLGCSIQYLPDGGIKIDSRSVNIADFIERMSANQAILQCLKTGLHTTAEIMEQTGISKTNTYTSLNRLKNKNLIIKYEDEWGLKSDEGI